MDVSAQKFRGEKPPTITSAQVFAASFALFSEGRWYSGNMVQKDDRKNCKDTQVAEDVKELPELPSQMASRKC